jgi:DMSO reductase anchor subunit
VHPALSVIVFTTATGAGYGLLAIAAVGALMGLFPPSPWLGAVACGLALLLVTGGLLASTLHLRHPERAWRAVSQWRSSWLSREGLLALITYVPTVVLALDWVLMGRIWRPAAILAAVGATATVACTGQIYASLKPVARWHQPLTTPCYLLFSLASGAVCAALVLQATGHGAGWAGGVALLALPSAWLLKLLWWREGDETPIASTPESATGLGPPVRLLEPPHSSSNYLQNEMGFRIARKHAAKLRSLSFILGVAIPVPLMALSLAVGGGAIGALPTLAGLLSLLGGLLVERWLFFAEARHTAMLYYGA